MTHVFIAYSHRNIDFARRIETDLIASGYSVWRDESAGVLADNWKCEVTQALDCASVAVVIVSPDSVRSENVDFEVEYALQQGVPIVGIQYTRYEVASELDHLMLIDDAIELLFVDENDLDQQAYEQTLATLTRAIDQSQRLMTYLEQLANLNPRMRKMISECTKMKSGSISLAVAV